MAVYKTVSPDLETISNLMPLVLRIISNAYWDSLYIAIWAKVLPDFGSSSLMSTDGSCRDYANLSMFPFFISFEIFSTPLIIIE